MLMMNLFWGKKEKNKWKLIKPSYQKVEASSDSGCVWAQPVFSSLFPAPCRRSLLRTASPWAQTAHPEVFSCCCSVPSCHPDQPAPLWSWGVWSAYESDRCRDRRKIARVKPKSFYLLDRNKITANLIWYPLLADLVLRRLCNQLCSSGVVLGVGTMWSMSVESLPSIQLA